MNAVWTVIIGLVIGLVARAALPGKDAAGIVVTTLLGICGAIVGTLVGRLIGIYGQHTFASFTMSVLGAVALLALYRRYGTALGSTQT
jgi:uncharacterized membrane protein YeaQ/YmgE (transglycosylase-associated protein family)